MEKQGKPEIAIKRVTQAKIDRLLKEKSPWSRAMLAKLRRGIGKQLGELPELLEIILGGIPEEMYRKGDQTSYAEGAIYTALTLFALHQQGKDRPMSVTGNPEDKIAGNSLGAAVGHLVRRDRKREPAIKRRFDAVITANDFTELSYHARGLVQLLRYEDIPLDYPRFAEDLYWYQFDEKKNHVRIKWGEDYYRLTQPYVENGKGEDHNE